MIRFFLLTLFLVAAFPAQAMYDPLSVANNKFGIHIADFNDIADVAPLVNSTGGDWGYVTLVASDADRDTGRWQRMFDQMRRLHLIPIVRIATRVEKDHWVKPDHTNFAEIVEFLDALNWPTENRYVILYNEPNHAKEWGNSLDPEGFARTTVGLARRLKAASEDFFILPAGLDASAASDGQSMDAAEFLARMIAAEPDLLKLIDGWTSHSYPNPGFSGSPRAFGRGTVRSYAWELSTLRELGLTRTLPVFITETGWAHREGKISRTGLLTSAEVGVNFQVAAADAWNDTNIAVITPFVFNYQDEPFDIFSFKRLTRDGGYYDQYNAYRLISKARGMPRQREAYQLTDSLLPNTMVVGATYTLSAFVRNTGQGILSDDGYELAFEAQVTEETKRGDSSFAFLADSLPTIEPGEKGEIAIHIKTPARVGTYRVSLTIRRGDEFLHLQTQDVALVSPPTVVIDTQLGFARRSAASDVSVLVYEGPKLLHKFTGLTLKGGEVRATGLSAILPGRSYRIVLLVPYYLPRQTIQSLHAGETRIRMKRMVPLDFNLDGTLSAQDLFAMIRLQPHFIVGLFVGQ